MALDKIPGTVLFAQRDVRETPAATATATSVGLTDPHYVTLQTDADLTNERVLTMGEGLDMTDAGAGGTLTINGESASDTNKGIATFQSSDFTVTSGDVALKAVVVMSIDGDSGTATPAVHNIDILGGTGITTVGANNDITITTDDANINHDALNNFVANEHLDWTADLGATNIHSGNYTNTTYTAGEGIDIAGNVISGENATLTNKGIVEIATIAETQTATSESLAVCPNSLNEVLTPIGSVIAWLKSYTNTPQTLPTGFVECAGQTLNDASSVYNGQTIPDLNGGVFMRGDTTSGGTGGSATGAHTHQSPVTTDGGNICIDEDFSSTGNKTETKRVSTSTISTAYSANFLTTSTSTLPSYYNIVWIMRIK